MEWIKKEHIYEPDGSQQWSLSHAQVPFALRLNKEVIRVFFATRDVNSSSSTTFVDVNANDPSEILYIHNKPVLEKGSQGSFDDSGTMPSWFLKVNDNIFLYYTAWNKSVEASYRLSIGLATSEDNGVTFKKMFKGPIMDRNINDPIWVGQPCVIREEGLWKMWYLSCEKIEIINNHPEPFYNVKYATSIDGVNWKRENKICIDFERGKTDAIGRPCVWKYKEKYFMFHSNRLANGYRENKDASYRIELSESLNGVDWSRVEKFKLKKNGTDEWDGIMNEYTSVIETEKEGEYYVFYNGNGFGASGFGYFILNLNK